jgi:hypothetical protein
VTNRREFLQIGIAAASVWPLASQAVQVTAGAASTGLVLPLYKVVYDVRFPHSVSFARRAAELGVAVHAIEGDMTRLWYDDLYRRWQQGPVAIAGLTAHGPMFCFEQLAMDQRMRVVLRAEHRPAAAGCVEHELSGPADLLGDASNALGRADWAARMAELVTHCPSGCAEMASAAGRTAANAAAPLDGEALYSWLIAPAVRV